MTEVSEAVLTIDQRRKRALMMRRYKEKLKRARERAQRRIAPDKNIKKRAQKLARAMVRKRVAGERGKNYKDLSPAEKIQVDKLLDKPDKVKMIQKLALRLIPKVKRAEQERLQSFMQGQQLKNLGKPEGHHTVNEDINSLFTEYFASAGLPGRGALGGPAQQSNKMLKGKDKDKKGNGNPIIQHKPFQEEKIVEALEKKSEKSGIDYDILAEVFVRGLDAYPENCKVTLEQYAFARVNSFINQGKTYFNEDADLQERNKANALMRKNMDASRGAKYKLTNKVSDPEEKHKTTVAHNKAIGRALRNEDSDLQELSSDTLKMYKLRAGVDHMINMNSAKAKDTSAYYFDRGGHKDLAQSHRKQADKHRELQARREKGLELATKKLKTEDCASNEKVDKLKVSIDKLKAAHKSKKAHDKALGESYSHLSISDLRKHAEHAIKTNDKNKVQQITAELKSRLEKKTGEEYKAPTKYGAKAVADFERISGKKVPDHLKETLELSELSDKTILSYSKKAFTDYVNKTNAPDYNDHSSKTRRDVEKRNRGIKMADKRGAQQMIRKEVGDVAKMSHKDRQAYYKKQYGEEVELDEADKMKGDDPCWKGYTMVGKKKKNGKEVPNCVPVKEQAPVPTETEGSKARKQIQTVPRTDDNRKTSGRSTRQQEVLRKVIHERLGNRTTDPKKREVGTDDIVATYKADTPFAEEAKSADRKPVTIPSFTRIKPDGTSATIPAKTVLRKSGRKIVGDGSNFDGK